MNWRRFFMKGQPGKSRAGHEPEAEPAKHGPRVETRILVRQACFGDRYAFVYQNLGNPTRYRLELWQGERCLSDRTFSSVRGALRFAQFYDL